MTTDLIMSDQIGWKARVEEMKRRAETIRTDEPDTWPFPDEAIANDYAALLSRITELEAEPDWKARALKAEGERDEDRRLWTQEVSELAGEVFALQSKLTRLVEACRPFKAYADTCAPVQGGHIICGRNSPAGEIKVTIGDFRTLSEALEGGDEMASVASRADAPRFAAAEDARRKSEGGA